MGQPQGLTLDGRGSQATCLGPSGLMLSLFRGACTELEKWAGRAGLDRVSQVRADQPLKKNPILELPGRESGPRGTLPRAVDK